ncbi:TonB-dependent siderophore receptor [Trinickia diaoshuihuensis]|uniref:TonB-dependent siderophore receptor n=1 Tax=Trinickia diaoshuihuensis TaxID=2292265 RepID=UPI000E21F3EC|nr:TonB-dependent siderophore receptor [Trinickia diaoshuihuensis]
MEWFDGKERRAIAVAASAALWAGVQGYAHAQSAQGQDEHAASTSTSVQAGGALPTVRVQGSSAQDSVRGFVARRTSTGTKTDTPLDEIPQTVNVVTSAQIESQGALSVNEALRYVPGFSSYGASTRSDWYTALRGFSPNPYIDGLAAPNTLNLAAWRVDPYQIESVTVLRGPTSVLYGQGDPGALVDIRTKQPTAEPIHEIEVQVGNDARKEIGLDLGGKLTKDGALTYRFVGVGRDGNMTTGPQADQRLMLAPSVQWRPDADTSLTVSATYLHDSTDVSDNFLPAAGTILTNPNGQISRDLYTGDPSFARYDKRQWSIGYAFEKRLDAVWTLRQTARYAHLSLNNEGTYGGGLDPTDPTQATLTRYAGLFQPNYTRFDWENNAQAYFHTGSIAHTVLFGFSYSRQLSTDSEQVALAPSLNLYHPVYTPVTTAIFSGPTSFGPTDVRTTLDSIGIYAQDQIKLTPRVVATIGGREDISRTRTQNVVAGTVQSQRNTAFSGRVGFVYLGDYGLSPYVSYATSFNPVIGVTAGGTPFAPTRGKQIEAGLRWKPTAKNLMLTAAIYQIDQTNVLTPDPNDPSHVNSVQTGRVRSRGIELSAVGNVTRDLTVAAAYAYQDVKNVEANDASLDKWPVAIPLPRETASVWGDWTWHTGPLAGLGLGAGVRYTSAAAGGFDNSLQVPAYALIDAAIHYDVRNWRFAVNATNLFDRRYVTGCQSDAACFYGNGRTVVATARYDW